ncbi:hypothetical protein ScPMuIL_008305 [Solemya velum]
MSTQKSSVKTNGINNEKSTKQKPPKTDKGMNKQKNRSGKDSNKNRKSKAGDTERDDIVDVKSQLSGRFRDGNGVSRDEVDDMPDLDLPDDDNNDEFDEKGSEMYDEYIDEGEYYQDRRPYTDTETAKRNPRDPALMHDYTRYEPSRMRNFDSEGNEYQDSPAQSKRGKIVTFFRNGDKNFKGVKVCINKKTFPNFETVLMNLSDKIPTTAGVRHIFSWPEGKEIKSIKEVIGGKYYIVSSVRKLNKSISYGEIKEQEWSSKRLSAGKVRKSELSLFQRPKSPTDNNLPKRPRVLTIISNLSRDSREKLILNPQTTHNFEEFLLDVPSLIKIPNPPARTMYTEKSPHTLVRSFSQLFRDFKDVDNFIICGDEEIPQELTKKRTIPSSNSGSESSNSSKKQFQRQNDDNIGEFDGGLTSLETGRLSDDVTLYDYSGSKRTSHFKSDKGNDAVRQNIDGKTKEFFPPSMPCLDDDGAKPDKKLQLDWVYGYQSRDIRFNLVVLPVTREVIYCAGAIVVLYDKWRDSQRHYVGHSEEISCITLHPNLRHIATGQLEGKTPENGAHVRIWDGISLSTYAVIGLGDFTRGVVSVGFSFQNGGNFLCVVDDSDRHVLSVWDWQKEKVIAKTSTTTDPVHYGSFYSNDDTILITYGKQHVFFWKFFWDPLKEKGSRLLRDKKSGIFQGEIPRFITSIGFSPSGDVLTGDSNGSIVVWTKDAGDVFQYDVQASGNMRRSHKKPVVALCILEDGTLLSGGGAELKAWDSSNDFRQVKERVMPEAAGHIRAMVPHTIGGSDGNLYIGTAKGCVLDGSLQHKFKFLIQGHSEDLWAVAAHPEEPSFISAGHDQLVIKWSALSHKIIWRITNDKPCTCVAIDSKGRLAVVGTAAGRFIVLNAHNGMNVAAIDICSQAVNAISLSPDGTLLAAGCHDKKIYLFSVIDEGQFYQRQGGALKGHTHIITNLDWSSDSRYIQSLSSEYDQLFWDVDSHACINSASSMRDTDWSTLTCTLNHSLIGPWSNLKKGEQLNVIDRSHYRDFIVTGDNRGRIRLYKYPSSTSKSEYRSAKVYSSDVTALCFLADDSFVLSSGGREAALFQWSVAEVVAPK